MTKVLLKVPTEALLKNADKLIEEKDKEIRLLRYKLGTQASYIQELENKIENDEDKYVNVEARIIARKERLKEDEYINLKTTVMRLRKNLKDARKANSDLICKLNKLEKCV